jgi:choline dehydrogenase
VEPIRPARWSAATAYLHPAIARPNLQVLTKSITTRVLLHLHAARRVELLIRGHISRLYAHREVIVCSEAYGTPHLLMLFGIGHAFKGTSFRRDFAGQCRC